MAKYVRIKNTEDNIKTILNASNLSEGEIKGYFPLLKERFEIIDKLTQGGEISEISDINGIYKVKPDNYNGLVVNMNKAMSNINQLQNQTIPNIENQISIVENFIEEYKDKIENGEMIQKVEKSLLDTITTTGIYKVQYNGVDCGYLFVQNGNFYSQYYFEGVYNITSLTQVIALGIPLKFRYSTSTNEWTDWVNINSLFKYENIILKDKTEKNSTIYLNDILKITENTLDFGVDNTIEATSNDDNNNVEPSINYVMGYDNANIAKHSLVIGKSNKNYGNDSFVASCFNENYGKNCFVAGYLNVNTLADESDEDSSNNVFIVGAYNKNSGKHNALLGYHNESDGEAQTVLGKFNKKNSNALLIIGNGLSLSKRENAFEIDKNNNVFIVNNIKQMDGRDILPIPKVLNNSILNVKINNKVNTSVIATGVSTIDNKKVNRIVVSGSITEYNTKNTISFTDSYTGKEYIEDICNITVRTDENINIEFFANNVEFDASGSASDWINRIGKSLYLYERKDVSWEDSINLKEVKTEKLFINEEESIALKPDKEDIKENRFYRHTITNYAEGLISELINLACGTIDGYNRLVVPRKFFITLNPESIINKTVYFYTTNENYVTEKIVNVSLRSDGRYNVEYTTNNVIFDIATETFKNTYIKIRVFDLGYEWTEDYVVYSISSTDSVVLYDEKDIKRAKSLTIDFKDVSTQDNIIFYISDANDLTVPYDTKQLYFDFVEQKAYKKNNTDTNLQRYPDADWMSVTYSQYNGYSVFMFLWDSNAAKVEYTYEYFTTVESVLSKKAEKAYVDKKDAENLEAEKTYTDEKAASAESAAKAYTDSVIGDIGYTELIYELDSPAESVNVVENCRVTGVTITDTSAPNSLTGATIIITFTDGTTEEISTGANDVIVGYAVSSDKPVKSIEIFNVDCSQVILSYSYLVPDTVKGYSDKQDVKNLNEAKTYTDEVISPLKSDITNEERRAKSREDEIESLFTMPTQEAVNNWLNEHPEATTTVQDESLEVSKLTDNAKLYLYKDYITPQMFGAIGDGIADDTNAIQNAINVGNNIFFPNGIYKITKPIEINGSGKCLFGYDKYHTKLKCVDTDAFHLGKNTERCSIKSIAIYGDTSEHNSVVFNNNTVIWTFNDIWVQDFGGSFFLANNNGNVNNIYFLNCQFENGGSNAIEFINVATAQINNIVVDNCNISGFSESGLVITGNNIKINGCTIQACEIGVDINPLISKDATTTDKSFSGISITSNYFEQCFQSYIRINCGYVDSTVMFGYGILILNNYGSYKYKDGISLTEKETYDLYPCVEIKNLGGNIYDMYNVANGGILSSFVYACNKFGLKNDSKILIDGGDILESDSIIVADGIGGNTNQSYNNTPYILLNMANATIKSKYNFIKKIIKIYNCYFSNDSVVDVDNVTSDVSDFLIEIPYNGISKVELKLYCYTTADYTIKVYGYSKDGVKAQLYNVTTSSQVGEVIVTLPNWAFTGNTLKGYVNTKSYTIAIKSSGKLRVYNPIVYCLDN